METCRQSTSLIQGILRVLPDNIRIVLVGDHYQCQPIGPGLIFQALVGMQGVPQTELTEVKRHDCNSGIPQFAKTIRTTQEWPNESSNGVELIECDDLGLLESLKGIFRKDMDRTYVLCATRECGMSGVAGANLVCRRMYQEVRKGKSICIRGVNGNLCATEFMEGDRIIFARKDLDRGIVNGSRGTIVKAMVEAEEFKEGVPYVVGKVLIDDEEKELLCSDVSGSDRGNLGYATTVHKAQGSEFPITVILIKNMLNYQGRLVSRVMDLTWVYTAITRAKNKVIVIGHKETAIKVLESGAKWQGRTVGFTDLMKDVLQNP